LRGARWVTSTRRRDLDLFAFHLTVAQARAAGELPPLPENIPHVP
jgi:hypothetical protein